MEQDLQTCPSCGASAASHSPCAYCGWSLDKPGETHSEEPSHTGDTPEAEMQSDDPRPQPDMGQAPELEPSREFRDLLNPKDEPEHLLEQVPEDMRGILAARLRSTEEPKAPNFNDNTASSLREQGFLVSEDARGARLTGSTGQTSDLSASDVVKMAADLDGGVQPRTTLPICSKCEAASPIGDKNCQWCGEPLP